MTPDCPACTAAERNPLSGLAQAGCRACLVRRVAQMPKCRREAVYATWEGDDLAQFVADVRACFARMHCAMAAETTFTRAGGDG